MGKTEDELSIPTAGDGGGAETPSRSNGERGCGCVTSRFFGLKCVLVLVLGVVVFLSAAFWVPPLSELSDPGDPDLDPRFRGHGIVACFKLEKSISFLQENIDQLKSDIFDEIQVPNTEVVILSLEGSPRSNLTNVVFGVDPERKHSQISSPARSLIRASFVSLVIRQSFLRLTTSLFGEPHFFEVLKFSGGITVAPYQRAFLLQKTQVNFNFTLNFSIYQVQENFNKLKSQLKSGLHLASYENLYISLTNRRGSTLFPPVTVQTSVLLAVGISPSTPRLKQLAQTITGTQSRNLGLNHTVFGKVKQVSLSSILEHSLNGGPGGSLAPAPAPDPLVHPHQHHRHHHHEDHDHDTNPSPSIAPSSVPVKKPPPMPVKGLPRAPASAPTPLKSYHHAVPRCRYGFKGRHAKKTTKQYASAPAAVPRMSPHYAPLPHPPVVSSPPILHRGPTSSHLPHVALAHRHPPTGSKRDSEPPDEMPLQAPSLSPSDAGFAATVPWLFSLLIALLLHLQAA